MKHILAVLVTCALSLGTQHNVAQAQGLKGFFKSLSGGVADDSENRNLVATIWVDPDGCEHWVMDDGLEGYMSAHLDRDGKPVCRAVPPSPEVCKTLDASTLFASGSATVRGSARKELRDYFQNLVGKTVVVNGHTDSLGGEKYNMDLSLRRAVAVAKIGQDVGVIAEPRGFGEQMPIADNSTSDGRRQNRRVELSCS